MLLPLLLLSAVSALIAGVAGDAGPMPSAAEMLRRSKLQGVNGGRMYFDELTGEFRRSPSLSQPHGGSDELHNQRSSESSKPVKRIKKMRIHHAKTEDKDGQRIQSEEETSSRNSYERGFPERKRIGYKTSDAIRNRQRTGQPDNEDKMRIRTSSGEATRSSAEDASSNFEKASVNGRDRTEKSYVVLRRGGSTGAKPGNDAHVDTANKFAHFPVVEDISSRPQGRELPAKTPEADSWPQQDVTEAMEGRELPATGDDQVYQHFGSAEEVLLNAGFNPQLSVQPYQSQNEISLPYDYTIGDIRGKAFGDATSGASGPLNNHNSFSKSTPSPAFPGMYFPPEEGSEQNPFSYDFTIGEAGPVSPLLNFLNGRSPAGGVGPAVNARPDFPSAGYHTLGTEFPPETPAPSPVSVTAVDSASFRHSSTESLAGPTDRPHYRSATPTTSLPADRRPHTTERLPVTGQRFPHFPSMEVYDKPKRHENSFASTEKYYKGGYEDGSYAGSGYNYDNMDYQSHAGGYDSNKHYRKGNNDHQMSKKDSQFSFYPEYSDKSQSLKYKRQPSDTWTGQASSFGKDANLPSRVEASSARGGSSDYQSTNNVADNMGFFSDAFANWGMKIDDEKTVHKKTTPKPTTTTTAPRTTTPRPFGAFGGSPSPTANYFAGTASPGWLNTSPTPQAFNTPTYNHGQSGYNFAALPSSAYAPHPQTPRSIMPTASPSPSYHSTTQSPYDGGSPSSPAMYSNASPSPYSYNTVGSFTGGSHPTVSPSPYPSSMTTATPFGYNTPLPPVSEMYGRSPATARPQQGYPPAGGVERYYTTPGADSSLYSPTPTPYPSLSLSLGGTPFPSLGSPSNSLDPGSGFKRKNDMIWSGLQPRKPFSPRKQLKPYQPALTFFSEEIKDEAEIDGPQARTALQEPRELPRRTSFTPVQPYKQTQDIRDLADPWGKDFTWNNPFRDYEHANQNTRQTSSFARSDVDDRYTASSRTNTNSYSATTEQPYTGQTPGQPSPSQDQSIRQNSPEWQAQYPGLPAGKKTGYSLNVLDEHGGRSYTIVDGLTETAEPAAHHQPARLVEPNYERKSPLRAAALLSPMPSPRQWVEGRPRRRPYSASGPQRLRPGPVKSQKGNVGHRDKLGQDARLLSLHEGRVLRHQLQGYDGGHSNHKAQPLNYAGRAYKRRQPAQSFLRPPRQATWESPAVEEAASWPNDKYWDIQEQESQEAGDHLPFLF